MTQEDKQLLLQDLSARLPYGVIVDYAYNTFLNGLKENKSVLLTCNILDIFISPRMNETNEYIKPYLRPMSSMTEEERKYLQKLPFPYDFVDWLNAHHFDYRGLIEKGLALEATSETYNKE